MKVWESDLASMWHLERSPASSSHSQGHHRDRISIPDSLQKPQGHTLVISSDFTISQRFHIQTPDLLLRVKFSTYEHPQDTENLIRDQNYLPSSAAMNSCNIWRRKGSRGQRVGKGGGRRRERREGIGGVETGTGSDLI